MKRSYVLPLSNIFDKKIERVGYMRIKVSCNVCEAWNLDKTLNGHTGKLKINVYHV